MDEDSSPGLFLTPSPQAKRNYQDAFNTINLDEGQMSNGGTIPITSMTCKPPLGQDDLFAMVREGAKTTTGKTRSGKAPEIPPKVFKTVEVEGEGTAEQEPPAKNQKRSSRRDSELVSMHGALAQEPEVPVNRNITRASSKAQPFQQLRRQVRSNRGPSRSRGSQATGRANARASILMPVHDPLDFS